MEDVEKMQEEMEKIGDTTGEEGGKKDGEEEGKKEEGSGEAGKEDGAAKKEVEGEKKEDADGAKKEEEDDGPDLVRELREQLRQSTDALRKVSSDYQKLHKVLVDKGVLSDEEVAASKAEEEAINKAIQERQVKLGEMVEIMELNPAYTDVRQVCTQSNFDDLIDAFARFYVSRNGGNLQEVATNMEREIWEEPNPYKKMYEMIKKYHPKFAKKEEAKKDEGEKKEEKKVTPSAANIADGGSGAGGSGWTAAKIDALDEDQLHTVPRDIYDKYLKGLLK